MGLFSADFARLVCALHFSSLCKKFKCFHCNLPVEKLATPLLPRSGRLERRVIPGAIQKSGIGKEAFIPACAPPHPILRLWQTAQGNSRKRYVRILQFPTSPQAPFFPLKKKEKQFCRWAHDSSEENKRLSIGRQTTS